MERSEQLWARRLRWRLRGAWQWPAYAVLTLLDAVILSELPPVAGGVDFIPGLIVASFANLFLIGAVAPFLARRLAARPQVGGNGIPFSVRAEVLKDRAAALLLGVATLGLIVAGLAARPLVIAETEDRERQTELLREYVDAEAPAEIQHNAEIANTIKLEDGYFRSCINYNDRTKVWCVFIDVDAEPPTIVEDPSRLPNQEFSPR